MVAPNSKRNVQASAINIGTARPTGGAQIVELEWGVDKPCTRTALSWDDIDNYEWPLTTVGPELRDATPVGALSSQEAGKEPVRTTEPEVFVATKNTLSRDAYPGEASSSQEAGKEPARTAGTTPSPPQLHKLASSHKLYVIQCDLNGHDHETLSSVFGVDIEFFAAHKHGKHYRWRVGVGKKAKPPSATATYLIPRYSTIHGQPQTPYCRASTWESAHMSLLLLDDIPNSSTQDALMDIINGTVQENAASIATGMVPGAVAQLAHHECLMYLDMATDTGDQQVTHVHWDTERYKDIAWVLGQNLAASRLHEKATRRTRRGSSQGGLEHGGLEAPLVGPPPSYESLDTVGTDDWKELIARLDLMVRLASLNQTEKLLGSETSRGKDLQNRVSYLGGFLLPLSIIAGIMSMADPYRPGSNRFWLFWAISVPAVCLCLTIIHADDIRGTEYYRPMTDEQYKKAVDLKKAIPGVRIDEAPKLDVDLPVGETSAAKPAARPDRHRIKQWLKRNSHSKSFTRLGRMIFGCWNKAAEPPGYSQYEVSQPVDEPMASTQPVGRLTPPPLQHPPAVGEPMVVDAGGDHGLDDSSFETSKPMDEPTASIHSEHRRRRRLPPDPVGWLLPFQRPGATSGHEVDEVGDHPPVTAAMRRHVTGRNIATPGNPPIVLQMEANGKREIYRREKLGWGGALKVMLGFETLPQAYA